MATFFDARYIGAYREMIDELRELLVDRDIDAGRIEQLEFRSDLKRGDKKRIWQALAKMLRAGGGNRSVMTEHYCQNDLFWWLADKQHCNLSEKFQTIKRAVYQNITNMI